MPAAGCSSAGPSGHFKRYAIASPTRTSHGEGAAAALAGAWDADDAVLAGLLAKSLAGRAARIAATQCQQVLAGIGFTAEHPFHRFLARALVLDSVLGSAAELPAVIGARLISAGTIPRLVDL